MKVIISKIILYFIWRNVYCSLDTAVANDIAATNIDNETNRNRTPICALHLFLTIFVAHFYKHKQKWDFSSFSEHDTLKLNISIYLRYIAFHSLKVLFIVISIFAFHHNRQSSFKFFISSWLRSRSLEIIRYMCNFLY